MKHRSILKPHLFVILAMLFLLGISSVFAQDDEFFDFPDSFVLPLDSSIPRWIDYIQLELGRSPGFPVLPITAADVRVYLRSWLGEDLSPSSRRLKTLIELNLKHKPLYKEDGGLVVDLGFQVNPEGYFSTNPDKKASETYSELNDDIWAMDQEWVQGYLDRQAAMALSVDWTIDPHVWMRVAAELKMDYRALVETANDIGPAMVNTSLDPSLYDLYIPQEAFISLGTSHWNASFGRNGADWGNGKTGNFLVSDINEYFDGLRLATMWDNFRFTSMYVSLQPWVKKPEEFPQDSVGPGLVTPEMYRAFVAHRIDLRILERINLAVAESSVIGYQGQDLMQHLNPLMAYHQWFMFEGSNLLLTLEASINPWRYIEIYSQIALDDIVSSYEKENSDTLTRYGSAGYLYGARAVLPLGEGFLGVNGEIVMTDPWFNNHDMLYMKYLNSYRKWSFLQPDTFIWVEKPLGYYAGSDVVVLQGEIQYEVPDLYQIGLNVTREARGLLNTKNHLETGEYGYNPLTGELDHRWANTISLLSEGPVMVNTVIELSGSYKVNNHLTLGGSVGIQHVENFRHQSGRTIDDLECSIYASLTW